MENNGQVICLLFVLVLYICFFLQLRRFFLIAQSKEYLWLYQKNKKALKNLEVNVLNKWQRKNIFHQYMIQNSQVQRYTGDQISNCAFLIYVIFPIHLKIETIFLKQWKKKKNSYPKFCWLVCPPKAVQWSAWQGGRDLHSNPASTCDLHVIAAACAESRPNCADHRRTESLPLDRELGLGSWAAGSLLKITNGMHALLD